jgi:GT2 family glycosyltransferase
MKWSVIICTHQRPASLWRLLESIAQQNTLPDEVLIIDGSVQDTTEKRLKDANMPFAMRYHRVPAHARGLTLQRNIGIQMAEKSSDILAFLDDDLELLPNYFSRLNAAFLANPEVIGIGGLDVVHNNWRQCETGQYYPSNRYYTFDGWVVPESGRMRIRRWLGLAPDLPPGQIPLFGHGRHGFPPSGKCYEVAHFMGGIAAFRARLFDTIQFSDWFQGYGLYEDFDFTVRAARVGKLLIHTGAQVLHHHAPDGRPNHWQYGQMVVRNGWYVWRQKHPNPGFTAICNWHFITLLLAQIRLANAITHRGNRLQAVSDWAGRMAAWCQLFISRPTLPPLT